MKLQADIDVLADNHRREIELAQHFGFGEEGVKFEEVHGMQVLRKLLGRGAAVGLVIEDIFLAADGDASQLRMGNVVAQWNAPRIGVQARAL